MGRFFQYLKRSDRNVLFIAYIQWDKEKFPSHFKTMGADPFVYATSFHGGFMSLSAVFQAESNLNTLKLKGKIDYETAFTLDLQIRHTINIHTIKHLVIDMGQIDFIGSTNLKKFYECVSKIAMDHNVRMILVGIEESFLRVFKLYQRGPAILEFETDHNSAKALLRLNH